MWANYEKKLRDRLRPKNLTGTRPRAATCIGTLRKVADDIKHPVLEPHGLAADVNVRPLAALAERVHQRGQASGRARSPHARPQRFPLTRRAQRVPVPSSTPW